MILFKGKTFVKNPFLKTYLIIQNIIFSLFIRKKGCAVNKVEKILICNLAHLGDVVLVTSIVPSLIKKYPNAKISFLVSSYSKVVVEALPYVYKIHLFDHLKLNRSSKIFFSKCIAFIRTFFIAQKEIKNEKYDVSIDPYLFYPNSHFLTYSSKVRRRIGYESGGGGSFLTDVYQIDDLHHVTYFNNFLLKSLGAELNENNPFYKPYLSFLDDLIIKPPISYWIFHPFSGDKNKDIADSFWTDLLEFFSAKKQYVIFTGKSNQEASRMNKIIGKNEYGINLVSKLSFRKFCFYIKNAKGIVSVDTVSIHISLLYDVKMVVLFKSDQSSSIEIFKVIKHMYTYF